MEKFRFSNIGASAVVATLSFISALGGNAICNTGVWGIPWCLEWLLFIPAAPVIGFTVCFLFLRSLPKYRWKIFLFFVVILLPFALQGVYLTVVKPTLGKHNFKAAEEAMNSAKLSPPSNSVVHAGESISLSLQLNEPTNTLKDIWFDVRRDFQSNDEERQFHESNRSLADNPDTFEMQRPFLLWPRGVPLRATRSDSVDCKGCVFSGTLIIPQNFGDGYISICVTTNVALYNFTPKVCNSKITVIPSPYIAEPSKKSEEGDSYRPFDRIDWAY